MVTTRCPCCGQSTEGAAVLVSLESNTVAFGSHVIALTATQTEIMVVLAQRGRLPVSREHMIERVYGLDEPDTASRTLDVHLSYLRRRIAGSGLAITNIRGRGYRLEAA
jgi:two-component system response regulator TctD